MLLLGVILHHASTAHARELGVGARITQALALMEQIVKLVEVCLDLSQSNATRGIEGMFLTAFEQRMLLGYERFDLLVDRRIAHCCGFAAASSAS